MRECVGTHESANLWRSTNRATTTQALLTSSFSRLHLAVRGSRRAIDSRPLCDSGDGSVTPTYARGDAALVSRARAAEKIYEAYRLRSTARAEGHSTTAERPGRWKRPVAAHNALKPASSCEKRVHKFQELFVSATRDAAGACPDTDVLRVERDILGPFPPSLPAPTSECLLKTERRTAV